MKKIFEGVKNKEFKKVVIGALALSVVFTTIIVSGVKLTHQDKVDFNTEFNKYIETLYEEYDCSNEVTGKIRSVERFVTQKMSKDEVMREVVKLAKEVGKHEVDHYQEDILVEELGSLIMEGYKE